MAPSHHLRPTLGTTRVSRLAFPTLLLPLLLSTALALSGCGAAQQAGAAAIVDGKVISDQDVQTVSNQLNPISPEGQKLDSRTVLYALIIAPFVLAEDKKLSDTYPASQARKDIAKVTDPSPATIDYVRTLTLIRQIDEAKGNSIVGKLAKAKITVNPRYGATFDVQNGLIPTSPNWIKPSATPPATR